MTALAGGTAVGIRSLAVCAAQLFSFSFTSDRWREGSCIALNFLADVSIFILLAPVFLGIFQTAELAYSGEKITCGDVMWFFSSIRTLKFAYFYAAMWLIALFAAAKLPGVIRVCAYCFSMYRSAYALPIRAAAHAVTAVLWLLIAFALSRTLTAPTVLRKNPDIPFFGAVHRSICASKEQSGELLMLFFSFIPHLLPAVLTCGISLVFTVPLLALVEAGMNEWIYCLSARAVESGAHFGKCQYTVRCADAKQVFAARQRKE